MLIYIGTNYNMNEAWNMMATPVLDNWQFIHRDCI